MSEQRAAQSEAVDVYGQVHVDTVIPCDLEYQPIIHADRELEIGE